MTKMRRYHTKASLLLLILAIVLLIHDFWPKNQPVQTTLPVAENDNVKFDFYTILPKQDINLKRVEIVPNSKE